MPSTVPWELSQDMFNDKVKPMKLFVKRVFISDNFEEQLLPRWLSGPRTVPAHALRPASLCTLLTGRACTAVCVVLRGAAWCLSCLSRILPNSWLPQPWLPQRSQ